MAVGAHELQAGTAQEGPRCFRCPRQRRAGETGWYFMDIQDRQSRAIRLRAYVCPRDYFQFADSERGRWTSIPSAAGADAPGTGTVVPLETGSAPSELIATLSHRGLTGWALLVRDVAEGRIRRLHLRKLPADPKICEAMLAFLNSAGAEITVERDLVPGSLRNTGVDGSVPVR